jgi:hypothetical protein
MSSRIGYGPVLKCTRFQKIFGNNRPLPLCETLALKRPASISARSMIRSTVAADDFGCRHGSFLTINWGLLQSLSNTPQIRTKKLREIFHEPEALAPYIRIPARFARHGAVSLPDRFCSRRFSKKA